MSVGNITSCWYCIINEVGWIRSTSIFKITRCLSLHFFIGRVLQKITDKRTRSLYFSFYVHTILYRKFYWERQLVIRIVGPYRVESAFSCRVSACKIDCWLLKTSPCVRSRNRLMSRKCLLSNSITDTNQQTNAADDIDTHTHTLLVYSRGPESQLELVLFFLYMYIYIHAYSLSTRLNSSYV